jgi:hypothetical protein
MEFVITAWGHDLVSCRDPEKIIITKDDKVFDDSVACIRASAAAKDLPDNMKEALEEGRGISLVISSAGIEEKISAFGSMKETLTDEQNITLTKTNFSNPSTVGIKANKGAKDLNRALVALLQDTDQEVTLTLRVLE